MLKHIYYVLGSTKLFKKSNFQVYSQPIIFKNNSRELILALIVKEQVILWQEQLLHFEASVILLWITIILYYIPSYVPEAIEYSTAVVKMWVCRVCCALGLSNVTPFMMYGIQNAACTTISSLSILDRVKIDNIYSGNLKRQKEVTENSNWEQR